MLNWHKIKCLALDVDGVLTDGNIFMGSNGDWQRQFYIRDGLGLVRLKEKGYKLAIITSSKAIDIRARAEKLKIDYFFEDQTNKMAAFENLLAQGQFSSDEIGYMGDDIIDLPVLNICGVSMTPADAHPLVLASAKFISKYNGGRGAVREACDILYDKGQF